MGVASISLSLKSVGARVASVVGVGVGEAVCALGEAVAPTEGGGVYNGRRCGVRTVGAGRGGVRGSS